MAFFMQLLKNPQLYKNMFALVVAVSTAIVLMAGLSQNSETVFASLLAFAVMVPVIGSAAVALYRDVERALSDDRHFA